MSLFKHKLKEYTVIHIDTRIENMNKTIQTHQLQGYELCSDIERQKEHRNDFVSFFMKKLL